MRKHFTIRWAALAMLCAAAASAEGPVRAARVLVDPFTGARWLLAANPARPGGPGMLVPDVASNPASPAAPAVIVAPAAIVIRAGDALTIDVATSVLSARYTAVALAPAAVGDVFPARLVVGAKPVRVRALGPGRAAFAPSAFAEAHP